MDPLDRLLSSAGPLLRRVDDILAAAGAAPDHPVWTELRRVRLLPGAAVPAVALLRPADLLDAAPQLRADAHACAGLAESLPGPGQWTGSAAAAYDATRQRVAAGLGDDVGGLSTRLRASADVADELAAWMQHARDTVALALAEVMNSTEAITLAEERVDLASAAQLQAAAQVATVVLRAVADGCERGADLLRHSVALAEPQPAAQG
jgi:hypothetical protein